MALVVQYYVPKRIKPYFDPFASSYHILCVNVSIIFLLDFKRKIRYNYDCNLAERG